MDGQQTVYVIIINLEKVEDMVKNGNRGYNSNLGRGLWETY